MNNYKDARRIKQIQLLREHTEIFYKNIILKAFRGCQKYILSTNLFSILNFAMFSIFIIYK